MIGRHLGIALVAMTTRADQYNGIRSQGDGNGTITIPSRLRRGKSEGPHLRFWLLSSPQLQVVLGDARVSGK